MAIAFVGGAVAGKAGATSGTSTIALDSGLTGGSRDYVLEDDIVIAGFAVAGTADVTLSITDGTDEYTQIGSEQYQNNTADANLRVGYKFMGATPDTATTFGPTTNAAYGGATAVYAFSGVDQVTPLDGVTPTVAGDAGNVTINPAAITPATAGAVIVVICGAADAGSGTGAVLTTSELLDFLSVVGTDNDDAIIGIGHHFWTSGTFTPAALGDSLGSADSWVTKTFVLRPAATGATGTLSATEAADTASLAGDVLVEGTLSATEATDTTSIAGDVLVQGSLSATEAADTASLAGTTINTVTGSLAATEASDTASLEGDVLIQGTVSATEAGDTASLQGDVLVQGTVSATEAADTSSIAGDVLVQGSVNASEAADTASLNGAILVQGSVNASEAADTISLAGTVLVQGTLETTEVTDTATFTGVAGVVRTGSLAASEAPDTASLSGLVVVQGTLEVSESADTGSFTGLIIVQGQLIASERLDHTRMEGEAFTVKGSGRRRTPTYLDFPLAFRKVGSRVMNVDSDFGTGKW